MDPPPSCKFYQRGLCIKGDACPFSHPTTRCRSFAKSGFCPYGFHCYFSHVNPKTGPVEPTDPVKKPICKFFLNGQCVYGSNCAYSHQLSDEDNANRITLADYKLHRSLRQVFMPKPNPKSVSPPSSPIVISENPSRPAVDRPTARLEQAYITALQPGDLEKMRDLEVDRLLNRYPPNLLKTISGNNDEDKSFCLLFSSTDPDWSHEVKRILIVISLPADYPLSTPLLSVPKTCDIPAVATKKLNEAIADWVNERKRANESINKVSLYLRPFFFWLDRTLNGLLTDAYSLVGDTDSEEDAELRIPECFNTPDFFNLPSNHSTDLDQMNIDRAKPRQGDTKDANVVEGEKETKRKDEVLETEERNKELDGDSPTILQQYISFESLELRGHAGSCLLVRLPVSCICSRCRYVFDWVFRLPPLTTSATEVDDGGTKSTQSIVCLPPHTSSCQRCRQVLGLWFTAVLADSFSNRAGTFEFANCLLSKISIRSSDLIVNCINCKDSGTLVTSLQPDRVNAKHCTNCQSLCGIFFTDIFISQRMNNLTAPRFASLFITKSKKEATEQKRTRISREGKSPVTNYRIQKGTPLPNNGTCSHYKMSFRWLRFPCCKRAFPCDVCHDEEVAGAHETLWATRTICGFCSTEQPITNTSGVLCSACKRSLTIQSSTSHWEGGRGCRDPTKMSNKERRKFQTRR